MATNSRGHVFSYTRSRDTRMFEFDEDGNYMREIGVGLYGFEFAHKVRVDPDDYIWAADEGSNLVIKFNPEGRVTVVLGYLPAAVRSAVTSFSGPEPNERYLFARPVGRRDVGYESNVFVSDGYFNHRVVNPDPAMPGWMYTS